MYRMPTQVESVNSDVLVWSIRAFYIFATYAIITVRFIPDLKARYLDYGPRAVGSSLPEIRDSVFPRWVRIQFDPVLDRLAQLTVPHAWFTHFYVCSTLCSAYWLMYHSRNAEMTGAESLLVKYTSWEGRVQICMLLLQIQSLRRLYECVFVAKESISRMWIGHYFIGIAFYLTVNVATWVEASAQINPSTNTIRQRDAAIILVNSLRIFGCLVAFAYNSVQQYRVHKYLASLNAYRVPDHPVFRSTNLICPHYAAEVNIYLSFTVLSAQDTRILNLTMLCATVFVIVNLGVTADLTKQWQLRKFPKQRQEIASRKKMLASIW